MRTLETLKQNWTWTLLVVLLLLLVAGAITGDRTVWPSFMGDEATYLMQAESLAFDLDLAYTPEDFQRFEGHWGLPPQGLILQSGDGGQSITFGKPIFYAFFLAPFVRLSPVHGPFLANALLLAFTCFFVARRLENRLGPGAPLWIAALVFASVPFAFVFWAHADLFLMCLTAIALALVLENDAPQPLHTVLAGLLLAVVSFSRPLYVPLFLPVLLALPRPRWRPAAIVLSSALGLMGLTAALHHHLTGSWTGYGALRSGFYEHTGYPGVDFPVEEWTESVREKLGNSAARSLGQVLRERPVSPSLMAWNSFYFLFGRHVGLLPYFFPLVLLLFARPKGAVVWASLLALAAAVALFLWTRPFNFYGGGGTLANRYFLPLYPALWFLPRTLPKSRWILVIAFLSAAFMTDLWRAPRSFPITQEGTYRYVTRVAERLLPYETSQSHLRLAGRDDVYDHLYMRFLSPDLRRRQDGRLRMPSDGEGQLVVGKAASPRPLELHIERPSWVQVEVDGAHLERLSDPRRWRLVLDDPEARHPMWWTWENVSLYRLNLRFTDQRPAQAPAEPVVFELSEISP